ncbi:hypothetical protein AB0442_22930 [Kitasatospora sp. NPDC085895]|uniref:hypothetical protein n=1 Tax=Kitasatospora sp. NPDC085895 TaxID=3155057 RepID=UPI00344D5D9F
MSRSPKRHTATEVTVVVDPAIPVRDRAGIADLLHALPRRAADDLQVSSAVATDLLGKAAATAGAGGALTAVATWAQSGIHTPRPGSLTELLLTGCDWAALLGLLALAGGGILTTVLGTLRLTETRQLRRLLRTARTRAVRTDALTGPAADLLTRAQSAVAAIRASRLHHADLAGLHGRTEEHLPVELWEIAQALQQYSDLAGTEADGGDDAAAGLRAAERKALAEVLAAAERRIEALELYAASAAEADRRLEELAAVERLEARSEQVLELLARTAAADVAAADTRTLAEQTAAAGRALAQAVDEAKDAADVVLPEPGAAA